MPTFVFVNLMRPLKFAKLYSRNPRQNIFRRSFSRGKSSVHRTWGLSPPWICTSCPFSCIRSSPGCSWQRLQNATIFIDGLLLLRERHFTYRPKHPWHTRWSCQLGHTPQDKIRLACTSWPMFCKQLHTEITYSHPSQAGAKNPEQFLKIKVQTVYVLRKITHTYNWGWQ